MRFEKYLLSESKSVNSWNGGTWKNGTWKNGTWENGYIWDESKDESKNEYVFSTMNPNEYFENKE